MTSQYGVGGWASTSESFFLSSTCETRAIELRLAGFVLAWNKHDPVQMASFWAEDGDLITPWGRLARGRGQVQQLFNEEQQGIFKTCSQQMSVDSVRSLGRDMAIVDADCTHIGARDPAGREIPAFKSHVFFVMRKQDVDWEILAARPHIYVPMPGAAS